MLQIPHPLPSASPGTTRALTSLHFGTPGSGPKAVIQAALHADEVPGMLVVHHLRSRLAALEAAGRVRGEVVLVPAANPIGMGQWALRGHQGRFELASGENFNRAYADLSPAVAERLSRGPACSLGADVARNVADVRAALRAAVAALPAASELQGLRRTLFGLAVDADLVLDLHCDGEALLHFYTTTACWPALQPLARCLQARAVLLAEHSGGDPFDEACSMPWAHLAARFPAHPLAQACLAVTIELRGEGDVSHALAQQDAAGIEQFLALRGLLDIAVAEPPPLQCDATPLAGSMPLIAPHGGAIVFTRALGEHVRQGDTIAELLDPLTGALTPLQAPVDGLFFARENRRFAVAGMAVGKVAGARAQREGALLSP